MNVAEALARHALLKQRARQMRANPTNAERKLWYLLRDRRLGAYRWRRQEVIDNRYIVDFVCFEHRLIVEADGSQHAELGSDAERDAWLESQGFATLRFWNPEILTNIVGVGETILAALDSRAAQTRGDPTPYPLPQGEGGLEGAPHV